MALDWMLVKGWNDKAIGAVGFVDDKAAVIISFYDDHDFDQDGTVSWKEKAQSFLPFIGKKGRVLAEVAMQAYATPDIAMRDPAIRQMAYGQLVSFAQDLIKEGIYTVYFARGVKMAGSGLAVLVTSNTIKQMVIREGFKKIVKEAFDAAT